MAPERDRLSGGGDEQQEPNGLNKAKQEAGDLFRNIFGGAKKKLEEIDTTPLQEGAKRAQEEAQKLGEKLGERYKGADGKFDPRRMAADAQYAVPGVGQAKALEQITGNKGGENIIDKIGGLFHKANEEITRLDATGFAAAVENNWGTLDKDHNGFVSKEEILAAKEDKKFRLQNAFMLKRLEEDYDTLRVLNNSEWFRETSGIAKDDLYALANAKASGTGFGAFTDSMISSVSDLKYAALAGTVGTAALNAKAVGTGKTVVRSAIAGAVVLAASAIYGGADYMMFRKGNLEDELKKFETE